jgi:hypothetical protein
VPQDLGLPIPVDLVSLAPQQCVLVTDIGFLRAEQNLWLDNLYIRFSATNRTNRTQRSSLVDCIGLACNLWLTAVTLQGDKFGYAADADLEIGAVEVIGGQLYAKGVRCRFYSPQVGLCTLEVSNGFIRICLSVFVTLAD